MFKLFFEKIFVFSFVAFAFSCYCYVLMEWLFFVTKPSLLSVLPFIDKLAVLGLSPLILIAAGLLPLLVLSGIAFLLYYFHKAKQASVCLLLLPALLLASTAILLIDNFSYTVLGFSISSVLNFARYLYGLLLGLLWWGALVWLYAKNESTFWRLNKTTLSAACLILIFVSSVYAGSTKSTDSFKKSISGGYESTKSLPNILIFSSDGIDARHMSAYGYSRKTTPFIDSLLHEAIIYQNHFTNSNYTTGSIGALLTGKLPTTTKVIYRPDIFTGIDAYQHLPGVLRQLGYRNGDFSIRHYADAYDLNLRQGFDYANKRSLSDADIGTLYLRSLQAYFPSSSLFLQQSYQRILGRLLHIFAIKNLENPYAEVVDIGLSAAATDGERMADLKTFIEQSTPPFFAHVHLLGTHGVKFRPRERVFSKGKSQDYQFMTDFYDDAILDYDSYVKELVLFLKQIGQYDNTLLILNSDHGKHWTSSQPIPLIIKLPGQKTGEIRQFNSQRIDIAPTILDYLGIEAPFWMQGQSLLQTEIDSHRPIMATVPIVRSRDSLGWRLVTNLEPPFYTLSYLTMVVCQNWYVMELSTQQLEYMVMPEHTRPCDTDSLPSAPEARKMMLEHLTLNNYIFDILPENNGFSREDIEKNKAILDSREKYLILPIVNWAGIQYQARLKLLSEAMDFQVEQNEIIDSVAISPLQAVYYDDLLIVPVVEYENTLYKMKFRRIKYSPLTFVVYEMVELSSGKLEL